MQMTVRLKWHAATAITLAFALTFSSTSATAEQLDSSGNSPNVEYTLVTGFHDGKRAFIGVGRDIDGQVNPELRAKTGHIVQLIIVNGDGDAHSFKIAGLNARTQELSGEGAAEVVTFRVSEAGTYEYSCMDDGHQKHGMAGLLVVSER